MSDDNSILKEDDTQNKVFSVDEKPLLEIRGVTKTFGSFIAVNNVDLEIYKGELFCLLGGSGCGKTTLLRMLAGFESPTSGQILIDGKDMSDVPPYERPTNMMFQNYALFPHMTVEKNIAFGLQQDGLAKGEIRDRIDDILRLVELQDFKKRRPQQLSGGQRQRVALARALVKEPKLLLLDEPLGALDKKLREQTQFELVNIQEKVGVTFVVVTHDQEEAMTLSSRIAVMNEGKFVQIGSPTEIYEFPENRLVADFIGSANIFDGVYEVFDELRLNGVKIGLVTDLTADIQFRKLIKFGLGHCFDCIVTSEEAGKDKPNENCFNIALEKLGINKSNDENIWMIGDDLFKDIKGSKVSINATGFIFQKKKKEIKEFSSDYYWIH